MSRMENLNSFLVRRLTAVAAEVFEMFKEILCDYEVELERMREDNQQLRQQLTQQSSDGHPDPADGFSTKQQNFIQNELQVKLEVTALQHEDQPQQPSCDVSRTSTPHTIEPMEEPTVGKAEQHSDKAAADNVNQIMILKLEHCDVTPPGMSTQDGAEYMTEDQYRCLQCGETFSDSGLLISHMSAHSETADTCEVCREILPSCSCVTRRAGVADEGVKPFSCKICGKSFSFPSLLTKHIRIHTGEKPYFCRFCGRGFSQKGHCKEHERLHTGERPHTCSVCFKGYARSTLLKSHIRRRHSDLHRVLQRKKTLKQNPV